MGFGDVIRNREIINNGTSNKQYPTETKNVVFLGLLYGFSRNFPRRSPEFFQDKKPTPLTGEKEKRAVR